MMLPLIAQIFGPIVVGLLMYIVRAKWAKYVAFFVQFTLLISSIHYLFVVSGDAQLIVQLSPFDAPVGMSLRLDRLADIMLLLNNTLFLACTVYNFKARYMSSFFVFLFISLQGLINGIFLSNDLFNIYLIIEVATIVVSVLIMFKKDAESMYDGMIYFVINIVAMSFFLMGIAFVYKYFGLFDFQGISRLISQVDRPATLFVPYALLLTGIGLKSAIIPVFSWLPKAHGTASAPIVVSAILSGVFVKTGLYLFIRITGLFGAILDVRLLFLVAGYLTAIAGFSFAAAHNDIKLVLAYSTISQVGLILVGLNYGTVLAYNGALYHILTHGIYKGLLFMVAGRLIQLYETRDMAKMTGLWQRSKLLSLVVLIAVLSMTGMPLLSGGVSKSMIQHDVVNALWPGLFVVLNVGTMVSYYRFIPLIFSSNGSVSSTYQYGVQDVAMLLLSAICVVLGMMISHISPLILAIQHKGILVGLGAKMLQYVGYFLLAGLIYSKLIVRLAVLEKIRRIDMSFNATVLSLVTFFTTIIAYFYIMYS